MVQVRLCTQDLPLTIAVQDTTWGQMHPPLPPPTPPFRWSVHHCLKTPRCFVFYYYMYGNETGSLVISLHANGTTTRKKVIEANKAGYKVIIEGIVGNGYRGDIAVDDFSFQDGACQEPTVTPSCADPTTSLAPTSTTYAPTTTTENTSSSVPTTAATTTTLPTVDISALSDCILADNLTSCGITLSPGVTASADPDSQGVQWTFSSNHSANQTESVTFPAFSGSSEPFCLDFSYKFTFNESGTVELMVELEDGGPQPQQIFLDRQQTTSWNRKMLSVRPPSTNYRVSFDMEKFDVDYLL
ncbi:hypothetical protein EB796_000363 [Bugula neritina]|uniref:MAM domain-containing protein n=1 Tax=Bugula neritina TaxID=10212 RepID=A0A7J7KT26_BUGNE|nr:hypothetical protein EB796_000363 [Bugula neritina]